MRIETKGLLLAAVAAVAVLGATFGVSALVRSGQTEMASQQPPPAKSIVSTALVAQGRSFYLQSCASCHGANARGGYGPSLVNEDKADAQIISVIQKGVKGRMPAFGDKYNNAQMQAFVAYLRTLK